MQSVIRPLTWFIALLLLSSPF
ncbi:hypothetical protein MTR67_038955 [Solanum verrucosum]|uniref:Uncharacterized protein n=1 Tax=Solanum verrucosum TaxID=315347 RepID=A0AAF0UGZ9_SOLVR|nr:hypothetical protein MTR67_038955 [Solanum verrucosum]